MSKLYKSSRGKSIDLDKLKLANEGVIAVGNMKINARGDELGPGGTIVATKNQLADRAYNNVSQGQVAQPAPFIASAPRTEPQNNAHKLNNIIENLTNPGNAPAVADTPATSTQSTRGSLADSLAKTTAVNQELMKPLNKKGSGPSRI